MVGKLEKYLYGTRDAALNWAEACTKVLIGMDYEKKHLQPMQLPPRRLGHQYGRSR